MPNPQRINRLMSGLQGTKLMTPEKARAIWAIYVWCRRTDELVDGPNASRMNPRVRTTGRGLRESPVELACGEGLVHAWLGLWQVADTCMHREYGWVHGILLSDDHRLMVPYAPWHRLR